MRKLFCSTLLAVVMAAAGTVNYSYDAFGRLVKIDYGDGGTITYTYDNAGNLVSRVVTGPAGAATTSKEKAPQKAAEKR